MNPSAFPLRSETMAYLLSSSATCLPLLSLNLNPPLSACKSTTFFNSPPCYNNPQPINHPLFFVLSTSQPTPPHLVANNHLLDPPPSSLSQNNKSNKKRSTIDSSIPSHSCKAYSFRKALPVLSEAYHAIAFDWLGFGFSDKPQPRYGFDYTLDEYVSSLESLINELKTDNLSLVVQGYFSPVVVKYASYHQEKIRNLILINPPLTDEHAKLPPNLSSFSTFLLGEIFSQDPLRASDKVLTSCGPYMMKEEDAMVYRRPYLTSGSSGFALNAISKAMKKDLKRYVEYMRTTLASSSWKINTAVCWGLRDRWLSYNGIEGFCKNLNLTLVKLPKAGHHVQEDSGEELGAIIAEIIGTGM